jgi:hypothetical protein
VRARQNALRDARRQVIIDAARRVFERVGLEGASIRMIAAEAARREPSIQGSPARRKSARPFSPNRWIVRRHSSPGASHAPAKARAGVDALYHYYQKNPDELWLGLYLFRADGVQPFGLSPKFNRDLNARLALAFGHITGAISGAGFNDPDGRTADLPCERFVAIDKRRPHEGLQVTTRRTDASLPGDRAARPPLEVACKELASHSTAAT